MNKRFVSFLVVLVLVSMVGLGLTAPAFAAKKKVALVLSKGLGDRSFVDSAHRGLMWASERLDVDTRYVEPTGPEEYESLIRAMAVAGYDLVITLYFSMVDATNVVADQFPHVQFATIDAQSDRPNVTSLVFEEHVGSFLVGVVAGQLTESQTIGFVGGQEIPNIRRFEVGFIEGVKAVNPDARILSGYAGDFSDPGKGKELAMSHYSRGADIIFAAAGKTGEGVIDAAKETGKYVIGVDSDQCYIAPENMVVSMMKMVDVAVFNTIEKFVNDEHEAGVVKVYGLAEGAIGPCRFYADTLDLSEHQDFPGLAEAMVVAEEYRQKILNGEIRVTDVYEEEN